MIQTGGAIAAIWDEQRISARSFAWRYNRQAIRLLVPELNPSPDVSIVRSAYTEISDGYVVPVHAKAVCAQDDQRIESTQPA